MRRAVCEPPGAVVLESICSRRLRLLMGWLICVGGCSLLIARLHSLRPWAAMWVLVAMVGASLKLLSWLNLKDPSALSGGRLLGYLFLWPGMRPQPFLAGPASPISHQQDLLKTGAISLSFGLILWGLAHVAGMPWWLTAWISMAAFSFVVHFGMLDLLAAAWRRAGAPVEKLFVCPVTARSLRDFWGKRWNRAFSGFAHDLLFVPAARRLGAVSATLIVFVFSGLVHELLISVPAGGGYGGPLLYFLLQGALVLAENSRWLRGRLRQHALCARLWTAVAVLLPLPLLFHGPFQQRVMLPFLAALGG